MIATRNRRILSISTVSDGGGSEKALIRMIRQLRDAGWECHVAVGSTPRLGTEYASAGAALHIVPMRKLTTSGSAWRWLEYVVAWPVSVLRLALLIRRLDPDVVHTNSLHSLYGWAAALLTRRPHIWHAREIVTQSRAALELERFLAKRFAVKVVAVSEAVAHQLDPSNLVVTLDEPDPAEFSPSNAGQFRARVGIPEDSILVGSVARIDTWKGFGTLVESFAAARKSRPDAWLVIAGGAVPGKEDYYDSLRAKAVSMGGVIWLGGRDDVADLMADLDLFVQVSTEPEPYGLVLAEALASGVPVVAANTGGPVEIVGNLPPAAARLVTPGDAGELADVILAMLPAQPSAASSRRARSPLRVPAPAALVQLFKALAG